MKDYFKLTWDSPFTFLILTIFQNFYSWEGPRQGIGILAEITINNMS